jgi:8-oxo-dGTP pyrophosphatase MutT (NUDIX family)
VRFQAAVDRLAILPDPLPVPPAALAAVRTDGVAWRAPTDDGELPPGRPAAVLVLLVPDEAGEARVVLTERVDRGGHHSGEVSLPGGRAEPEDDDLVATALREASEEVGLDPEAAGVRVVGQLEAFWIPVSDYRVTPIVAVAERTPVLAPAEAEVARIVLAPVAAFLPDGEIEIVETTVRDWPIRYGAYPVEGLRVWGATARILGQLGALLGAAAAEPAS